MEDAVLNVIAKALWDPHPTETDEQSCQLAEALGYPFGWRVVRTPVPCNDTDNKQQRFFDRIYSGDPTTPDCDGWMNHAGAMAAAVSWGTTSTQPSQYMYRGGHWLPLQASFRKGDKVQVLYQDQWWDAKILRVKEYPNEQTFRYQVYYFADSSKQSGVDQTFVRRPILGAGASQPDKAKQQQPSAAAGADPLETAAKAGFPAGWQAFIGGRNKWKLIAPDGTVYPSKKSALAALEEGTAPPPLSARDPPWRTTGDDPLLGRRIWKRTEHRVSARRTVTMEQQGTVVGYIAATDVDMAGQPGFVSPRTHLPAPLYHVTFTADRHTAYAEYQVTEQDMEASEVREALLPEKGSGTALSKGPSKNVSSIAPNGTDVNAPSSTEETSRKKEQPAAASEKEDQHLTESLETISDTPPGPAAKGDEKSPSGDIATEQKPFAQSKSVHAEGHDNATQLPEVATPAAIASPSKVAGDKRPLPSSGNKQSEHDDKRQRTDAE